MARYKQPISDYVESLAETLSDLTGCEMEGTFGISDMPEFEKSIVDKLLSNSIVQTYSLAEKELLTDVEHFSSRAILTSIIDSPRFVNEENFELGFGLGSGFQLYCDDKMVITAGGGGGGGISWGTMEGSTTFGGGSGYGIQLLSNFGQIPKEASKHEDKWVFIGGGSGCGTCGVDGQGVRSAMCDRKEDTNLGGLTQHVFSSSVVCGDQTDENAIPNQQFREIIRHQFNRKTFGKCKHIRMSGGGGGGGGQVGCGYSEGGGFGFYVDLSCYPSKGHTNHNKKHKRVKQVQYEEVSKLSSTVASEESSTIGDWSAYRDFGPLVQAAVSRCSGYGNWECVCTQTHALLRDCAINKENLTVGGAEMLQNAVNCTQLNLHSSSYERILNNSCKSTTHVQENSTNISRWNRDMRKLTQEACDSTQKPLFTATQSWSDSSTHNVSFFASNSSDDSFWDSIAYSLSAIGFTVSTSMSKMDSPALLSANSPTLTAIDTTFSMPMVWIVNSILCLCLLVLLPALLVWRYTKIYSNRNGYVELQP